MTTGSCVITTCDYSIVKHLVSWKARSAVKVLSNSQQARAELETLFLGTRDSDVYTTS